MLHLKVHLRFHSKECLKIHKMLMVHLLVQLRVHLRYIKATPKDSLSNLHKNT